MQRYFGTKLIDNKFILNEDDLYHIKTVMRMKENDLIEVVYDKNEYICTLDNEYNALIKEKLTRKETKDKFITLIVPLLKEQKFDLILQKATELGVSSIIPVKMERSIIKLDNKDINKKIERWSKICKEASEQSKRVDIPEISKIHSLNELKDMPGLNIICSTSEKSLNIKNFLQHTKNCDRINVVVGPEGGISPKEEELLESLGFTRVSLGNRIMRVETVPLYILSIFNYEFME